MKGNRPTTNHGAEPEILADDVSRTVKAQLSDSHRER